MQNTFWTANEKNRESKCAFYKKLNFSISIDPWHDSSTILSATISSSIAGCRAKGLIDAWRYGRGVPCRVRTAQALVRKTGETKRKKRWVKNKAWRALSLVHIRGREKSCCAEKAYRDGGTLKGKLKGASAATERTRTLYLFPFVSPRPCIHYV